MSNIVVFGNSGSGKSTLARQLSADDGLAHLDLDTLAWKTTSPPARTPIEESAAAIERFMASNQNWVIEGCYSDLLAVAIGRCSEIIFMDLSVDDCIENAKSRPWEPHKYQSKSAQDANLEMLIDWIKEYPYRTDVFSKAVHEKLYDEYTGCKRRYTGNRGDA